MRLNLKKYLKYDKMKYRVHKLLQITTIAIIVFAAYVSFKQVEGFQTRPTQIRNSATLDALLSSLPDTSSDSMPAWLTIDDRLEKGTLLKNNMNKTYPEHTTIINNNFTNSKGAGDKDDITLDKLYTLTYNNYIPKSTTLDEFKSVSRDILTPMPVTPTWMINIIPKMNLLKDTVTRKMEGKGPSAEVLAKLDKIQSDIFTASKTTEERDAETLNKVLNEQITYANTLLTNTLSFSAFIILVQANPKPVWYTAEREAASKKLEELAGVKAGPMSDSRIEFVSKFLDVQKKAFDDSKAKGDKDDITFDKINRASTDYLNNINTATSSESSNLPLYIGAGVGGVAVLGTFSYFMFFR